MNVWKSRNMKIKRFFAFLLTIVLCVSLLPVTALADGGIIAVTLKSGLPGVADVALLFNVVDNGEDFVNGTFCRHFINEIVYTSYKVSDVPESFGRTDLLCWKVTSKNYGYVGAVHPGDTLTDKGEGDMFTLEAIWDGLEQNSYAFSSPTSVTVTENALTTSIPFTLSELALGSANRIAVRLLPGDFTDGENKIHYTPGMYAWFTENGQTDTCTLEISSDEWAKAKAGRYTATLQYQVTFELGYANPIRTLYGSVDMTLQVGHDISVSSNNPDIGTASASVAMAREGETVTLTATPNKDFGLKEWVVNTGGVTINSDNTFVMGNADVSVRDWFNRLFTVEFRNYNSSLLKSIEVLYGETPAYPGETPTRPSTERIDYVFTGWDPPFGPIGPSTNKVYTAQYREEAKNLVIFDANGGSGEMVKDSYYVSDGTYTLPQCGFTAPDGYVFKDWMVTYGEGSEATSSGPYMAGATLRNLTTDITLTAQWLQLSVKVSPTGAGTAEYNNGSFKATANEDYTFDHWEYANDEYSPTPVETVWPRDNPYKPDSVDYKIYTAVFTANEYTLTIADGIQNGTVTKYSGTPKTGSTIKLNVTPDAGYKLATLTYTPEGGEPVSITEIDKNGRYQFTMPPANVTVTAVFVQFHTVTIDEYIINGTVTADKAEAAEGETVTLTATPDEGYELSSLAVEGYTSDFAGVANNQFSMPAFDVLVKAVFVPETFSVTVNNGTGGGSYATDASVTITANDPETGQQFKAWTGADGLTFTEGSASTSTATFTMPDHAVTLTAKYKMDSSKYLVRLKQEDGSERLIELECEPSDSIDAVMEKIQEIEGFPPEQQRLYFDGVPVELGHTLADYDITRGDIMDLVLIPVTYTVAAPTFSPAAGAVESGTEVTISCETEGASILYDINGGEDPSTEYTGPIKITEATTITAIAIRDDMSPSEIVTASYTILIITPTTYTVTVNSGTADKTSAAEGEAVSITANDPETGKQFKGWTGADGLTFTDGSATTATATFTMPASAVTLTATYEDIPEPSNISVDVKIGEGVPETTVKGLNEAVAKKLATTAEIARVEAGETLLVYLDIENIDATVPEADRAQVIAAVTAQNSAAKVGMYLDLSMYKKIGNDEPTKLTDLQGNKIKFTLAIPEELRKTNRVFYIVRVHEGVAEIIATGTGESITGESDLFSTYALAYADLPAATYTVTVTNDGHGTAAASPVSGATGTEITLTATPSEGYQFKEWKVISGGVTVTDNKFTIGTADVEIMAIFEAIPAADYTMISGGNGSWTKGSGASYTFKVKRNLNDSECFSHFTGVEIDGVSLSSGEYTAKVGSTIVTLKAETLQKLSVGDHTVTILFDDGSVSTRLTVKGASTSPTTGDNSHTGLWIRLMVLSGLSLAALAITGKKRRKER